MKPGRERIAVATRTRAEKAELQDAAGRAGVPLGTFILDAALAAARGSISLPPDLARELDEAAGLRGMNVRTYLTYLLIRDARARAGA